MAGTPSLFAGIGAQFFDNTGNILSGGKLYTYVANTTTPVATYTTNATDIAHTNPIILDAAGRVPAGGEIWLKDGDTTNYKFVVKDANDVLIATYDFVPGTYSSGDLGNASNPALGDALVGFRQADAAGNLPNSVNRTVHQKFQEMVSVKDFGAVGDGVTDDSAAFDLAWAYIKASLDNDTANLNNVNRGITVPPGTYFINKSVDWTNLIAWNIYVDMRGAKVVAGPGCAGKAVIDATNVRGLHIEGGYIESTQLAAFAPFCGLLIGPAGTTTCGNNSLRDTQIQGVYTLAPYVNIGSETTYHYNCYFAQTNVSATAYAYVGDGLNSRSIVVSDYTTLRAVGVAVSFTKNKFYGCHFRNYGGGSSIYLSFTNGWEIDSGCYILAFDKSNVELFQSTVYRNLDLTLMGLYETSQGAGVKHAVTFIVPDGETSGLLNFVFKAANPTVSMAIFNVTNPAGGITTGNMVLSQADIRVSGRFGSSFLFSPTNCDTLTISGQIMYRVSQGLNLYDINKFNGIVYTREGLEINGAYGTKTFNYMLIEETTYGGQVFAVSKGPRAYLGVQNGAWPILRAEGDATDIDLALQGKGTGLVRYGTFTSSSDVPVTGYVQIKDAAGNIRKLAVIA